MDKKKTNNIIKALVPILIVGIILIVLVGANEVIETLKAKENYQLANYQTIIGYMEEFSEYELDDEMTEQLLGLLCGIADETNAENNEHVSVAVCSIQNDMFCSNDAEDMLLSELIHSIDSGNRRLKGNYDYYNTEKGNYRFLIRIEHDGIINILMRNGLDSKLLYSAAIFFVFSILLVLILKKDGNLKYRRIAGTIFIIIWIGIISFTSVFDLNILQKQIAEDEAQHITSLIEFYYRQDLIEHGDEIEDRREFAQGIIDQYVTEDGNIADIKLNENYHDDLDTLEGCLTVTFNESLQKNKQLSIVLSAILFLVLAIILYDKLSERVMEDCISQEEALTRLDKHIITAELINITGTCLTWSLMLPRLIEVVRINFGTSPNNYVASVYSAGVIITTIVSALSSGINRLLKRVKTYFLFTFFISLAGITAFALIDNFVGSFISYFLICVSDGMCSTLIYFYIAGCEDPRRKESFLIQCRSTLSVGQSIGIIIGGVLGSIFRYRYVLLIADVFVLASTILLLFTNGKEYRVDMPGAVNKQKRNIKDILNKKQSFLFLSLIVVPLAFYGVFLGYKFPIDILSLGLTTAVISFISMSERLVSAYTSKFTYTKLKKKMSLINMTYLYLISCIVFMFAYQLNPSIVMIIIVSLGMGLLDSFGMLSYREAFIDISQKEDIAEDDANVMVNVGNKLGYSVGPSLLSICNNAVILPIIMAVAFTAYKISSKKIRKKNNSL